MVNRASLGESPAKPPDQLNEGLPSGRHMPVSGDRGSVGELGRQLSAASQSAGRCRWDSPSPFPELLRPPKRVLQEETWRSLLSGRDGPRTDVLRSVHTQPQPPRWCCRGWRQGKGRSFGSDYAQALRMESCRR